MCPPPPPPPSDISFSSTFDFTFFQFPFEISIFHQPLVAFSPRGGLRSALMALLSAVGWPCRPLLSPLALRRTRPWSSCLLPVAPIPQESSSSSSAADVQQSEIFHIRTCLVRLAALMCKCLRWPGSRALAWSLLLASRDLSPSSHSGLCCRDSFTDLLRLKGTSVKKSDFQEPNAFCSRGSRLAEKAPF